MHEISLSAEKLFLIGSFNVTNARLTSIIVSILIVTFTIIFRRSRFLETIIEFLYGLFSDVLESRKLAREFLPLLTTFFIFIVINNWFGLLPGVGTIKYNDLPLLRSANADLSTTFALAIISITATAYYGIKHTKSIYIQKFFNFKNPIFFAVGLLELLGEFSRMLSFSFRLFGNIFAGEILLLVIAFLVPVIAPLPFIGLEIFVGLIQALVFTMLTLVFLKIATTKEGH
ncbi:ATP synthase F0 subunit A [Candidatus Berkelbacteria bacterium CG_4_10_14_0_8_um_filter_39_42]|uniref:ATP synthase subunit a n=1 Tax=Candidatus Berkelbacteria bacterium CG03_land_8_20_14_0_80_40_36 TaxID=1974509 RepID=A0A2M7CI45_9BACT|nr:MAG: ATP synthase F0 subunit A [Candidatus Berkelbacteria bacterium CG03_land_8_20_14_0_80_40_36]PIX30513.1 MAG: ATP synthase F0 subunit A [Candidatus Berkelbacteria bacterium CG_4_8_14_3_um_filter_39_27]PIZ28867.1 MAG: ATP synthase F0 subunit A [Candidatus Berkelbacteria bacterium CG_4_10_14_0_8_um_filter_39_42]